MSTIGELDNEESQLQKRLQKIQQDKNELAKTKKKEQLEAIKRHDEAEADYLKQALEATDTTEKKRFYLLACQENEMGNAIRLDLNLPLKEPTETPVFEEPPTIDEKRMQTLRKINVYFWWSLGTVLAYSVSDYLAGIVGAGFFGFGLKTLSKICFVAASLLSAIWIINIMLFRLISSFSSVDLVEDFNNVKPAVRLWILTILAGFLLMFLRSVLNTVIR